MPELELLRRDWRSRLKELVGSAERSLFIAAPFITRPGVDVVQSSLSDGIRERAEILVLTCLDKPFGTGSSGISDPASAEGIDRSIPLQTVLSPATAGCGNDSRRRPTRSSADPGGRCPPYATPRRGVDMKLGLQAITS
jgi:hypothetical protein